MPASPWTIPGSTPGPAVQGLGLASQVWGTAGSHGSRRAWESGWQDLGADVEQNLGQRPLGALSSKQTSQGEGGPRLEEMDERFQSKGMVLSRIRRRTRCPLVKAVGLAAGLPHPTSSPNPTMIDRVPSTSSLPPPAKSQSWVDRVLPKGGRGEHSR